MQYEITHSPTFSKLDITMNTGEAILAQPNSMLCMTTGFELTAKFGGQMSGNRFGRGFKTLLTGESAFTAVFTAKRDGEMISLAPPELGEIIELPLAGAGGYFLTSGAFLACDDRVQIEMKYGGFKGWLSQKGFFLMHVAGEGHLFLASYGAVIQRDLADGERIVVDNRYVIAFSDSIKFELVKASKSLGHSIMSGEGLVNRYTGPGRMFYQTRGSQRDSGWLQSFAQLVT